MMFVFMVVWTWNDISRMGHIVKKKMLERKYHMVSVVLRRSKSMPQTSSSL